MIRAEDVFGEAVRSIERHAADPYYLNRRGASSEVELRRKYLSAPSRRIVKFICVLRREIFFRSRSSVTRDAENAI
jgi:hypothetical protein